METETGSPFMVLPDEPSMLIVRAETGQQLDEADDLCKHFRDYCQDHDKPVPFAVVVYGDKLRVNGANQMSVAELEMAVAQLQSELDERCNGYIG